MDRQTTVRQAIETISVTLNKFAHSGTTGIVLRLHSDQGIVLLQDDLPLSQYELLIKSSLFLEYSYKDELLSNTTTTTNNNNSSNNNNNNNNNNKNGEEEEEGYYYYPEMWNVPDYEGQLIKQGHFVKNWKMRWFILQHNKLFYFKNRPTKYIREPTGVILLKGSTLNLTPKSNKNNCFEIIESTGKSYLIYSENKEEIEVWIKAIEEGINKIDTTPNSIKHHLHIDPNEFQVTLHDVISAENPRERYDCDQFEKIGQGGLAKVYCVTDKVTNNKVAIKCIRITSRNLKYIIPEILNHKTCHHVNVVQFLSAYFVPTKQQLWVALEYMPNGSLADFLEPTPPKLDPLCLKENIIAYVCREVLKALSYIHSLNRIHRDIKSDNILIGENYEIKLADFGFAAHLTETRRVRKTVVGTPYWMAPELIDGYPYGIPVDIWSLGIVIMECAEGLPPYFQHKPAKATELIRSQGAPPLKNEKKWTNEFRDFLSQCLVYDPSKRSTTDQLLAHPFLKIARDREDLSKSFSL